MVTAGQTSLATGTTKSGSLSYTLSYIKVDTFALEKKQAKTTASQYTLFEYVINAVCATNLGAIQKNPQNSDKIVIF